MEVGEVYRDADGDLWHVALDPTSGVPAYMVVGMGMFDLMAYRIGSGGLYEAIGGEHELYCKANGQLVLPEPKLGEVWKDADDNEFFIVAGGRAVCAQGASHRLCDLKLVKKLWPRDDD